jgi:hypothetical protein
VDGSTIALLVLAAGAVAVFVGYKHLFRGELVGSVKGLMQGEAAIPGSTPSIYVRRFPEAGGVFTRTELQVGLVDARKSLEIDTEAAKGLAQALREAEAWVKAGP